MYLAELSILLTDSQIEALSKSLADQADPNRWRNKKELAAYFACSIRTVEHWADSGAPIMTLAGKRVARVVELERWLVNTNRLAPG